MLSRRHIRIKVFQAVYAHIFSLKDEVSVGEKELLFSLNKITELNAILLSLLLEIKNFALQKIEDGKNKNFPTEEELNPNLKFVDNRVFSLFEINDSLAKAIKDCKIKWTTEGEFNVIKKIYNIIKQSDEYREYMNSGVSSLHEDKQFIIALFKRYIGNNELLHEILEDRSIYWNDDIEVASLGVINAIDSFRNESGKEHPLQPLFRDDEDKKYAIKLFRESLQKDQETMGYINAESSNWDLDRLAKSDLILMQMGIVEAMSFPSIPLKVTLNEYIEISKYYSTPKSSKFINGILDKVFAKLKAEGKIKKSGRGLINKSIKK